MRPRTPVLENKDQENYDNVTNGSCPSILSKTMLAKDPEDRGTLSISETYMVDRKLFQGTTEDCALFYLKTKKTK